MSIAPTPAEPTTAATVAGAPLVELREISVAFGGVHAVQNVTVDLRPGEVVGLVGLMGLIAVVYNLRLASPPPRKADAPASQPAAQS